MSVTILIGDCMEKLREIPDASIQCCVTSPPYWGLRDYKIPPTVWGGTSECDHSWGGDLRLHKGGPHGDGVMLDGGRAVVEAQASTKDINAGAFCRHCNAWRGNLGLEPTPALFVEHMVLVFAEVWRVLRPDGTLWLNLGDSYATGAGAVGLRPGGGGQGDVWAGGTGPMTQPNRMPIPGLKPKDLVGIPWRVAFALQDAGWWLRQEIIWHKPNPMPESVTDRCTKAHEHLFLLAKAERYFFDAEAIAEPASPGTHARLAQDVENQIGSDRAHAGGKTNGRMKAVARKLPGNKTHKGTTAYEEGDERHRTKAGLVEYATAQRKLAAASSGTKNNSSFDEAMAEMPLTRNKRSVWTIGSEAFSEAHFATFPPALVEPCILAGSREGDTVLDPFGGAGTTGMVADRLKRSAILVELNPAYAEMAERRIAADAGLFASVKTA